MGGPCLTEQAQNADTAHISLSITASCPANIKHSDLHFSRDGSVAMPHIQRLIPKGRGSEKRPYDESPS